MTCPACEARQELDPTAIEPPGHGYRYFVRVGNANVELVGCTQHVAELVDELNRARRAS